MREDKIIIKPLTYITLLSYEGILQVNEHGWVKLKGQIPYEKKRECMEAGKNRTWVNVTAVVDSQEHSLFYGLINTMRIEVENKTCTVDIELITGSSQMDQEEHLRSFQNPGCTYNEILEICNKQYSNNNCDKIMSEAKQKSIDTFLVQYKETDWEFIKRLASREQTVVVAEYKTQGIKYYFGLPDRKDGLSEGTCEYSIRCDMQEYGFKKAKGLPIKKDDTVTYMWEDREIYELGQNKVIDGRTMYIYKIVSVLKKNELCHTYYMKTKSGICQPIQYNENLTGVSLFANIVDVKHEKVQIQIDGDSNNGAMAEQWFPFSTVYSSSDGTGWYCMPEKGDRVRLYFPTHEESLGYVISAYHGAGADLRSNPEIKFWRNKEGKEIQLTPDHVLMTNNEGTYIQISDDEGIEIVSGGSVTIQANNGMNITSKSSSIEISASKKVRLKQGQTQMNLGGDLRMQGARIKI